MDGLTHPIAISVVIPYRGHPCVLKNCLRGLEKQNIISPYEVILVIDTADPSVFEVVTSFTFVRLVRSKVELTPGGARNLGVEYAQGQYIAFIDADCVPELGWLEAALSTLTEGSILVGGPVLDTLNSNPIAIADNMLQFADFSPHRPDGKASYLPVCNLAMIRNAFLEIGGFSETLPVGEDGVFSRDALSRWPTGLYFTRNMIVRHRGRASLRIFLRHQEVFGFYRGYLGLQISPLFQGLGSTAIITIPIICKRFSYILCRIIQWNVFGLRKIFSLLPVILLGLNAWAKGFYLGCRARRWSNKTCP